jgi:hypothetical protein
MVIGLAKVLISEFHGIISALVRNMVTTSFLAYYFYASLAS